MSAPELRVTEFDLAAAVQEDAEDDADGIGRDMGGDLVAGPVAGSGDGGEVVLGIVPGIWWGRSPSLAGAGTSGRCGRPSALPPPLRLRPSSCVAVDSDAIRWLVFASKCAAPGATPVVVDELLAVCGA